MRVRTPRRRSASLVAALLAALALAFAACGDDGKDGAPSGASEATAAPAATVTERAAPTATPAGTAAAAAASTATAAAQPASDCRPGAALTLEQTEGPYYKQGSPERTSLVEPGMTGTRLVITGQVLTADCRPVARAWLDFWQADAQGAYDNAGFRLRGHQFTDEQGRFRLETVIPGEYPGRTPHIHVKVRAPNGPTLTSQVYFPNAARNQSDGIFRQELLLRDVRMTAEGATARFDFIVRAS